MKYTLLTGLSLFLSCSGYAQSGHRLIIYSEDSTRFTVSVNELQENKLPAARVEITGIAEDAPEVLIEFEDRQIPPVHKAHLKIGNPHAANNPAYTVVYALRKSSKGYRLELIRRFAGTGPHEISIESGTGGTSVEISNPGNVHIRVHR